MDTSVRQVFDTYTKVIEEKLLSIRKLIYEVARETKGVGPLTETLKWGEPSYLTEQSQSGSMIRLHSKSAKSYGIYFHCQTSLVRTFRELYSDKLHFEKNRGILFTPFDKIPTEILKVCFTHALTYKKPELRAKP